MRSTRDFFVGIMTGLTVGLLVAPRPGRESRRLLKEEYDKRVNASSGSAGGPGLAERLTSAFEQVKAQVNNYIQQQENHKRRLADTGKFDYQLEREHAALTQPAPGGAASTRLPRVSTPKIPNP